MILYTNDGDVLVLPSNLSRCNYCRVGRARPGAECPVCGRAVGARILTPPVACSVCGQPAEELWRLKVRWVCGQCREGV